jgi:hypothetical protein
MSKNPRDALVDSIRETELQTKAKLSKNPTMDVEREKLRSSGQNLLLGQLGERLTPDGLKYVC